MAMEYEIINYETKKMAAFVMIHNDHAIIYKKTKVKIGFEEENQNIYQWWLLNMAKDYRYISK